VPNRSLFIFRRDLRLEDNTGLLYALKTSKEVVPAFVFTPEQIDKNPYRSDRGLQFLIESLEDLEEQLHAKNGKLYLFHGDLIDTLSHVIEKLNIEAVVVNRDYTPYSIKRDGKIAALCKKKGIDFHSFDDALLNPPEKTLKADGKPYTIFTPFYKNCQRFKVADPISNRHTNYCHAACPFAETSSLYKKLLPERAAQAPGGREAGLKILKHLADFSHYKSERDFPAKQGTTHLSPHLKFTTLSPREVFHAIHNADLKRSLYWRDFFSMIAFYFPHVFEGAFHPKFDHLKWENDKKLFSKWCEGETGFPIVDAGMRELKGTGYMHNRVRMIVASFLVKDLHIDWRWGEKYFAQMLIDYDPAVNNGNWQWSASTGCDAQPYFRIFNPWSQQEKFDPDCLYIKKWVPELAKLSADAIHNWAEEQPIKNYPAPILDHSKEAKEALSAFKKAGRLLDVS
jgi:deoxyribodipyrimidine photo-lyase